MDIMVHSAGYGYSSILHFISTGSDCCNIEASVPAIYYHNDGRLLIASAFNEKGNQHISFHSINLEKWYHIEIVQAIENGKVREYTGCLKKTGISVQGSFKALIWPKIKKSKKTNAT